MRKSLMGFLLYMLCFFSALTAEVEIAYQSLESPLIAGKNLEYVVQWAKEHLPQKGVLKEEKDGFVYLKVDDEYIYQLFSMLSLKGYSLPPYFRRPDSPGAHISIFYSDERRKTGQITEIGQKYTFSITGFDAVPPNSREYIVLTLHAPELEKLREKYGLSPLLKGHAFHITVAKKNKWRPR